MDDNEIEYLDNLFNKDKYKTLHNNTYDNLNKQKRKLLKSLDLSDTKTDEIFKKLETYIYINKLHKLQKGNYYRWININNPKNIVLNTGAILCDIIIDGDDDDAYDDDADVDADDDADVDNDADDDADDDADVDDDADTNVYLLFKGFKNNFFRIKFVDIRLFKKLEHQELIILYAIDYINNTD